LKTDRFKKVAAAAAVSAGNYIAKNVGKIKSIRYKGETNIVTDIDKRAEDIIIGAIKKSYPRHNFLAEEKTYLKRESDFTWIIDPIDGTTNFLHGFPFFCVSVALAYREKVIVGVVYDPSKNELFHAEHKKGAFLNRKRIRVSGVREVKKALLSTGFAYNVKKAKRNNVNNFAKFLKTSQAIRRPGSAALDICYVACGRFDGFWELRLSPWDTAAGFRIVEEAGGRVTKFDGTKYTIYDQEILVSNSRIHARMVKTLLT